MKTNSLKAACLAVGLATAWGGQADAVVDQLELTITPNNNLSHAYFLYGRGTTALAASIIQPLPNLEAGISTNITLFVERSDSPAFNVIGVYDETNKLVTLGIRNNYVTNAIGNDFSTVFAPYTEDAVATALLSNDTTAIKNFILGPPHYFWYLEMRLGETNPLVDFSLGSDGGSLSAVVVVPEPSTILLAGFGGLILFLHVKRRKRPLCSFPKRIRSP